MPTDDEPVTLVCGDALDVLRGLSDGCVDAVVTDPPYGINGSSGTTGRARGKGNYSAMFADTEEYVERVCVPAVRAALALARRGAVTPGNRCMWLYPRADEIGCFWQPAAVGCGLWGFCCFQPILFYGRDPRIGKGQTPSSVTVTESPPTVDHPCPKPMGSWRWLVKKASLPGETVLDPFMGSGTTGVACIQSGRRFIGIELDPGYFAIAQKRINDALGVGGLFPPKSPAVADLFASETPT